MKNSEIRTRAKNFAIKILSVCEHIETKNGKGVLVNQIVRSSTSIGANSYEANYASSKADFVNKLQIALRECYETEYWIDMLYSSNCISENIAKELLNDCGIIRRMLVKSINTVKDNIVAERNN
jgi:four helix bundle protein